MRGGVSGVSQPSFGLFRLTCAAAAACRRNPIHNYLQLPRTGRPAAICCAPCHDRIGSDEQTSHNSTTQCNDSWCDSTIPASESEKHFRKSGQMLTRASVPPTFLIFFFLFFRVLAFWIADLKVSTGWREEHSHALLPPLQLRNHLLKYYKEIRKK